MGRCCVCYLIGFCTITPDIRQRATLGRISSPSTQCCGTCSFGKRGVAENEYVRLWAVRQGTGQLRCCWVFWVIEVMILLNVLFLCGRASLGWRCWLRIRGVGAADRGTGTLLRGMIPARRCSYPQYRKPCHDPATYE